MSSLKIIDWTLPVERLKRVNKRIQIQNENRWTSIKAGGLETHFFIYCTILLLFCFIKATNPKLTIIKQ
jgi:hypothetical protein